MEIVIGIVGLVVGLAAGWFVVNSKISKEKGSAEKIGAELTAKARAEAEEIKKRAQNEGRQMLREEKQNQENELEKKKKHLADFERGLTKKELAVEQKTEELQKQTERTKQKESEYDSKKQQIESEIKKVQEKQDELANKLTAVAGLSREEAKNQLIAAVEEEAKVEASKRILRIEEEAKDEAEKRAKRIVGIAIQRFAGEYVAESTISTVELADDGIKGRLIGREGRNIRAFEQICGVDLIIDDTPGVVTISSFNVVRKEIARMTIERLMADGRIHPAKIEEFYDKSKHEAETR